MTGDEFKQRFMPYSHKLYGVALALAGSAQEAEDIVQDAYMRLWTRRDRMPQTVSDEAYCVAVVKNVCYDRLRGAHIHADSNLDSTERLPSAKDVAAEVENRNLAEIMRRCISRLPELQRRLITMRDIDGAEYDDIARVTGLSMVNIRVTLSRARKTLREQFNEIRNYGTK